MVTGSVFAWSFYRGCMDRDLIPPPTVSNGNARGGVGCAVFWLCLTAMVLAALFLLVRVTVLR